ncbi:MAG: hypothetical protein DMG70_02985 [Acidobacteria bacterium]|nr:MAG: hypothetical protein DMG70_02985 [Acidobacteriota bacterium]
MGVRIVEAGQDRFSAKVYFPRQPGGERQNIVVRADGENPACVDRDRPGTWQLIVHRPDVRVVQNHLRLNPCWREQRQCRKRTEGSEK